MDYIRQIFYLIALGIFHIFIFLLDSNDIRKYLYDLIANYDNNYFSVKIKTESDLPSSGFDGVVVRLIGSRDTSNPIAINGMYTGRHQCFTG